MLTVAMEGCREKKMGKIDDAQRGEGVGKTYLKILKRKWLCEGRKDAAGTFLIEILGFFAHSLGFLRCQSITWHCIDFFWGSSQLF